MTHEYETQHEATRSVVHERSSSSEYFFIPVSIILSGLMIAGAIVYAGSRSLGAADSAGTGNSAGAAAAGDIIPKLSKDDVILGDAKAPVTMFLYEDYQCPFCHHFFSDTEAKVRDAYVNSGKVKMVFRNFQFLGPESTLAGQAVECAKDQNKFWAYHDELIKQETADGKENNGNITRDMLVSVASTVKLNTGDFSSCLDNKKYATLVEQEKTDAAKYGVNSTPTIFVNSQKIVGAQPYEQIQQAIEAALAKK
jgi:protein-disulfide isomerase